MRRALAFTYGLVSYLIFALSVLWLIPFLGNVIVPRTVDAGGPESPFGQALLINLVLIALFAVQHSVMARLAFKQRWTQIISPTIERSTYVLLAGLLLYMNGFRDWLGGLRNRWSANLALLAALALFAVLFIQKLMEMVQ